MYIFSANAHKKMDRVLEEILSIEISEDVYKHLMPHQIPHLQNLIYSIRKNGVALDSGDTGSGKSYTVIALCAVMGLRPFFNGLKGGIPNLYKVCEIFGIEPIGNINYESIKNGKYYESLEDYQSENRVECPYVEVVKVHDKDPISGKLKYDKNGKAKMIVQKFIWKLPENTIVVFDEAHKCKNGKTSGQNTTNSKFMASIKPYISKEKNIYCILLSATITDKLENFDVVAYILGLYRPYQSKIYKQFLRNHGRDEKEIFQSIHKLLFPVYASRMSIRAIKEDTGNSVFRTNDVKAVIFPVDKQTSIEIEENHQMIKRALKEIRSKGLSKGWGIIIRYWQRIEVLKVPSVVDTIIQNLQDSAVVVFINFSETKKLLVDHLTAKGVNIQRMDFIDGEQKADERENVVDRFQNNNVDLLICQIKAGGVSLSLHDLHGKQRKSLIFPTWSATDIKQSLGRIYRANAKTDAIQRIVYCKCTDEQANSELDRQIHLRDESVSEEYTNVAGECNGVLTIEEKLCQNVNVKLENIEMINNGNLDGFQNIDEIN